MSNRGFVVKAWKNGKAWEACTYGLTMSRSDRDAFLKREWGTIDIHLPGHARPVTVNVDKRSLWSGSCIHVISGEIGAWLKSEGLAPWQHRDPPKFVMVPRREREFEVRRRG
jgi:hypothetical protein